MAVKTEIWVGAFLRRHNAEGRYGAVIKRGAAEAGALYVVVNHLDGTCHLFGPAPGGAYDERGDRRWIEEAHSSEADAAAILARRRKSDPDIWIVEIEDPKGTAGLTVAET